METFLKSIKLIRQKEQYKVSGYVREAQKEFPDDNYFIIPPLVIYTILYYFHEFEGFHPDNHGEGTTVNDTNDIITLESDTWQSAYGKMIINATDNPCIYEWKMIITCIELEGAGHLLIGIHSFENCDKILDNDFTEKYLHTNKSSRAWAMCDNGKKYSRDMGEYGIDYGDKLWEDGDILKMILNTNDNSLSFGRNDTDYGVAFANIALYEQTYMVVAFGNVDISVQLLSFTCKYSK